jgi:hypothetical protein
VSDRVLPQGRRGGTALPGVRELPQEDRRVIWFPGVSSGGSPQKGAHHDIHEKTKLTEVANT